MTETDRTVWTIDDLERDPLPRWGELIRCEAAATAPHELARVAQLRSRYESWESSAAAGARVAALLMGMDGMPAVFRDDDIHEWVPPWVPLELADAWQVWRDCVMSGRSPGDARTLASECGPPKLLATMASQWDQMLGELTRTTAGAHSAAMLDDWEAYVDRAATDVVAAALVECAARHSTRTAGPRSAVAVWRFSGPAALLAGRAQLCGHPVTILGDCDDDAVLDQLVAALHDPQVRQLTLLARSDATERPAGGVRTLRVA